MEDYPQALGKRNREGLFVLETEKGTVTLVLDAESEVDAAVRAFQWSCDKQATIEAGSPLEHIQTAEALGWQLEETISVSERGFDQPDAQSYDTLEIVAAWQGYAFPWQ